MRLLLTWFTYALFLSSALGQLPKITDPSSPTTEYVVTPRPAESNEVHLLLRYPSQVVTTTRENNTVEVELLLPRDAPKPFPCVILLHYWGATDNQAVIRLGRRLNEKGIGAAILTLPHHMRRAAPGSRSGLAAIQPDPASIRENMTQAVFDVKRLIDWLQTNPDINDEKIGLAGVSLGGIVGALSTGVDSRIAAAAFLLAGGDLAHLLFNSSVTVEVRRELRRKGIDEADLRKELQPIEPLNYARPDLGPTVLVVGAKFDNVVPVPDTEKLIEAWHPGTVVTLDTGHYGGVLVERRIFRTVADFFASKFNLSPDTQPKSFGSPTIRVGLSYAYDYGLTVGAGIDIFKTPKRDWHVSGFITPIGPVLFGGKEVGNGFSVGIGASRKGPTIAAFWSVVL